MAGDAAVRAMLVEPLHAFALAALKDRLRCPKEPGGGPLTVERARRVWSQPKSSG